MRRQGSGSRALVLAAGSRLQYRTLRCAAECFDAVFVLGTAEAWPLRYSVACSGFTNAAVEAGHFELLTVEFVNDVCKRLCIDVVLPSDGETTRWLGMHGSDVAAQCYPVPSAQVFDTLDDKFLFNALCDQVGVPVPKAVLLNDTRQLAAALDAHVIRLPAVAKPTRMWGSFGVVKLEPATARHVAAAIKYTPILIQDYVVGRDISAFFLCRNGIIQAAVIYEKTQKSVNFFNCDSVVTLSKKIIEYFSYDGVIGFDIRECPDSNLFFLECNPRFWYNMDAVRRGGLNFVALGLNDGSTGKMCALNDMRVDRPRALYSFPLWKTASSWRLAGECARDIAFHLATGVQGLSSPYRSAHGQAV
jgi:hypothetical protein